VSPDLAVPQPGGNSLDSKIRFAQCLADASLLPKQYQRQPANVLLAIEMGESLGLSTIQAITGIHVVEGRPSASADLLAALVRRAGHKLRVRVNDEALIAVATLIRSDDPEFLYEARWDMAKAKVAGLLFEDKPGHIKKDNWRNYPGQMLRSRAISEVCRMGATDALYGVSYTPEELGADVETNGQVVDYENAPLDAPVIEAPPAYDPNGPRTPAQSAKLFVMLSEAGLTEREDVLNYVTKISERSIESTKELTGAEMDPIFRDLQKAIDAGLEWSSQYVMFIEPETGEVHDAEVLSGDTDE
jgi:hypothetical protein